ncbi:MAG: M50 family metallopeptidase [Rhodobacter sp.]|nr:M50 family metallopeptidase [Rhodobacter sp.]
MPEDGATALADRQTDPATLARVSASAHFAAAGFVETGGVGPDGKSEVYLPDRDLRVRLHPRQLTLLRLYDGTRDTEAVLTAFAATSGGRMKPDALGTFEDKMRSLGFLVHAGQGAEQKVDPFAGIEYGLARRRPPKVIFNLDDTDRSLGPLLAFLRRPAGLGVLACLGLLVAWGWVLSFQQQTAVWGQFPRLLNTVWWVFLFYPVWFTVMTLHEFGHALACMAKGVPMREVGIGRRRMLFVGWAKPDQAIWSALGYGDKVFTVIAGPLVNLSFFGLGAVLWNVIQHPTMADIVLSAALLPLFTMVPTLIPTNKGDAYLLVSEAIGQPGYYTRATRHVWSLRKRLREGGRAELFTPLGGFGVLVLLTRLAMLSVVALGVIHGLRLLWRFFMG